MAVSDRAKDGGADLGVGAPRAAGAQLFARLARAQHDRPWAFVVVSLFITAACLPLVLKLDLNADMAALLPETCPSVRDLRRIENRFGVPQPLVIAIVSKDRDAMHRFTRAFAPEVEKLVGGELGVASVDWNVQSFADLVERNKHLYLSYDELVAARDAVQERLDWERARANPLFVSLDDEAPRGLEEIRDRIKRREDEARESLSQHPEGFFESSKDPVVVIYVRVKFAVGDMHPLDRLTDHLTKIAGSMKPETYAKDMAVRFAGPLLDVAEEQKSLADAALAATLVTVGLVAVAIFIFFLRFRAIWILLAGLIAPMAVTFALAEVLVDYLNATSAFLSAIVIGNGLNPHVIWLARYFENRRNGDGTQRAIEHAHVGAWAGTLSASVAAACAYGSLVLTDFRAFRDFGIIGGIGMMLCWFATILITPALAALAERATELRFESRARQRESLYGLAIWRAVNAAPRAWAIGGAIATVAFGALAVRWFVNDPMEYDFSNLQSVRPNSPLQKLNRMIGGAADDTTSGNAIAVLAASPEDGHFVRDALVETMKNRPNTIGAVRAIDDFLPSDQERKLPVLAELRRLLLDMRAHADDEQKELIDKYLPAENLRALRREDIPETVARPFLEKDGTLGTIVYAERHPSQNRFDGRYLAAWTAAARTPRNRNGSAVAVTGSAPVIGDLVTEILSDGPKAVGASLAVTMVIVVLAFRRNRNRVLTLLSHMAGVVWMVGLMAALDMKLNFLNFVALPITFGLGVDYAVNVMRRFAEDEAAAIERGSSDIIAPVRSAVLETGGAVVLCSLTTVIGYIALYTSTNRAVNSFGLAMSLGEITCLSAAVVCLPGLLVWLFKRRPPT